MLGSPKVSPILERKLNWEPKFVLYWSDQHQSLPVHCEPHPVIKLMSMSLNKWQVEMTPTTQTYKTFLKNGEMQSGSRNYFEIDTGQITTTHRRSSSGSDTTNRSLPIRSYTCLNPTIFYLATFLDQLISLIFWLNKNKKVLTNNQLISRRNIPLC